MVPLPGLMRSIGLRFQTGVVAVVIVVAGPVHAQTAGVQWDGDTGIRKTTSEIMALPPLQRPPGFERIRSGHELEGPDRSNLPQAPGAESVSQWPRPNPGIPAPPPGPAPFSPQTLGISFTGATLADAGAYPPDCMGAVGPTQFVVFINGRLRSFNKTTGATDGVLNVDPDVFFSSVMTPVSPPVVLNFTSDPQVRYDRLSGRWFVTIIDVPCTNPSCTNLAANRALVAVSDAASGGVISGSTVWTFFYFQGDAANFLDYPSLGIDVNALYIGGNMFTSAGSFVGTNGYVVQKTSVLGGGPVHVTTFAGIGGAATEGPYAPRGVDNYDPLSNEGYFIGVSTLVFSRLDIRRVSSPGSATPTISANILLTVPTTSFPITVANLGGINVDALDDRLFAAHIRNGRLWTAHNIAVTSAGVAGSGGQVRDGVRWYELNGIRSSDNGGVPVVVQSGTIFNNATLVANARQYWIPSVMVSGQGHAALGFSTAGAPFRIDAATVGRLNSDALGTVQTTVIYTASSTAYNPAFNRWGDYSFTCLDPLDDMTMWTIQEFCNAANSWAVQAVKLLAPPPARPSVATPNSIRQGDTGVNVVITGTSSSGSGFFDPGSSFPNRISASVSGTGVTVNSVTYTDPTHVTLNLTVSGAAPTGDRTVTITNPDGQSATSPAIPAILTVDVPLPIQLASFTGSFVTSRAVRLEWTTVSELNNFGFEIERSPDMSSGFVALPGSFTPGHGTTNEVHSYSYVDESPAATSAYYRLKQIDLDGTVNHSEPILVSPTTGVEVLEVPAQFSLDQNYPNPFNPSTVIKYGLPVATDVKLEVFNMLGQRVSLLVNQKEDAGYHEAVFDNTNLSSGVYLYIIQAGEFRASKKLLLLR